MDVAVFEKARLARDVRFDGRFFTGVTSTGIYCRPVCPAPPPKPAHVRYFLSAAAAAAAGFRPCLRCRPEASPGTPAWLGSSSTVSRALRLIGEGALDDGGVEPMAERLGVGPRHLRRLFLRHLGATPVAVAQTRRVHFAKKLIDETSLPMTEVALASGFRSIRRFNAAFRALYGRPPSQLRAGRQDSPPGRYTFHLAYRPPYDWDSMAEALSGAGPRPAQMDGWWGRSGTCPTALQRSICLDGRGGEIAVRPVRGRNCLELQIDFPEPAALLRIVTRVRRVFDLDADPAAIATHLGSDPRLKHLLRRWPGLRVAGDWEDTASAADPWHDPWNDYRALYLWKQKLERQNELSLSRNIDRSAADCGRPELRPAH